MHTDRVFNLLLKLSLVEGGSDVRSEVAFMKSPCKMHMYDE